MAKNGVLFPRFFKVFLSETATDSLVIPLSFMEFLHDPLPKTVKLQGTGGKSWKVSLTRMGGAVYFTAGWPTFAEDHQLKNGEFMTFVYDGHGTFEVSIFERWGSKETRAVPEAIELSDSVEEETSMDIDGGNGCDEVEEISQSVYPIDDDETETNAPGNVDIAALTNPHFQTNMKNRIYELLIPANVVKENSLTFGEIINYIDEEGTIEGERGRWADDRVCFKGWDRICRRNRLKKFVDAVECELLHHKRHVHSVRVHVLPRRAT